MKTRQLFLGLLAALGIWLYSNMLGEDETRPPDLSELAGSWAGLELTKGHDYFRLKVLPDGTSMLGEIGLRSPPWLWNISTISVDRLGRIKIASEPKNTNMIPRINISGHAKRLWVSCVIELDIKASEGIPPERVLLRRESDLHFFETRLKKLMDSN